MQTGPPEGDAQEFEITVSDPVKQGDNMNVGLLHDYWVTVFLDYLHMAWHGSHREGCELSPMYFLSAPEDFGRISLSPI